MKKISTMMIVCLFTFSVLLGYFSLQTESSNPHSSNIKGRLSIEENNNDITIGHPQNFEDPEPLQSVRKIVFSSNRAGNFDIWVMDADGTNQVQLTTEPHYDGYPVWSPDYKMIAFSSDGSVGNWDIWAMDEDGSNQVRLTTDPDMDWYPTWSPDGEKIAFMSNRVGNLDIWVMDADGSNQVQLGVDLPNKRDPAWSPDGKKIAFDYSEDIWVMDADGSNKIQLTTDPGFDRCPAWSPDGSKIAFHSGRTGNWDIWVMSADGSNNVQLTTALDHDYYPAWSSDGENIAFNSNRAGNDDIWVMDADGNNKVQLTTDLSPDWDPDWGLELPMIKQPDLIVEDISFDTPSPIENGTSVKINATIHNIGQANASNVVVRFYDSELIPGNQIDVDQVIPLITRNGGTEWSEITWTATPSGMHNIYVFVDPDDNIAELNETNNIANRTIEVGNPDYIPWNIPSPQQKVSVGSSILISSQVKNVGNVNATAESTIAFYNQSTPLSPFKTYAVPSLNASEISKEYNATWTAPTTPGTYNVVIKVDFYNGIEELNENNNTYVIEFNATDKPITTIHVGSPQYGTSPRHVNSSTQFWFSVIDYSGTGYNTYYYVDTPPWNLYTGLFIVPAEGAFIIYFNSTNNLGGIEDTKEFDIIVDNTPPTTTINAGDPKCVSSETWVTYTTEFNLSTTDGGLIPVGLNYTEYRVWNGTWSDWYIYQNEFTLGANDGMRYVEFYSEDWLGNSEPVRNETYIVDNTPPITTISPDKKNVKLETQFALTAFDDGCDVNYTEYSIDNGDWENYTSPFSIDTYGHYNITYRSIDNLGNIETEKTLWIYIPKGPITTLNVGTPQYGTTPLYVTSSTQFTFTVEDYSGTGYDTYYYVDNPPWNLYSGAFMLPAEGEHVIYFNSTDNLGNVEDTNSYTVRVDNTPPTTSISVGEPKYRDDNNAHWNVTSSAAFVLSAVDKGLMPVGVQRTEYRVDEYLTWITYVSEFNLSGLDDGIHTLYLRSVDNLGNVEAEKSLVVNVDNTPPTTTISPDTDEVEKGILFTFTATDGNGSGVNNTQYSIDGEEWVNYTSPFAIEIYGHHVIKYRSVDNLGNVENEKTLSIITPEPREYNWKPLIALVFTIILLIVGTIVSFKRHLKFVENVNKNRIYTWMIVVLPFVIAEIATGIISLMTNILSIPPLLGAGMVVDLTILIVGLVFSRICCHLQKAR